MRQRKSDLLLHQVVIISNTPIKDREISSGKNILGQGLLGVHYTLLRSPEPSTRLVRTELGLKFGQHICGRTDTFISRRYKN